MRVALSLEGVLIHRIPDDLISHCGSLGIERVQLPSKMTVQILPDARIFVERLIAHPELEIVWMSDLDHGDVLDLFNRVLTTFASDLILHDSTQVSVAASVKRLHLLTSGFYFVPSKGFQCDLKNFEACYSTDSSVPENATWIGPDDLWVTDAGLTFIDKLRSSSQSMHAITPSHRDLLLGDQWILRGSARSDRAQRLPVLLGWMAQGYRALTQKFPKPHQAGWLDANQKGAAELQLKLRPILDLATYQQVCGEVALNGDVVRVFPLSVCKQRAIPAWVLDVERKSARCLEFDPFSGSVFSESKANPLKISDCDEAPILTFDRKYGWFDTANFFTEKTVAQDTARLRKNLAQQTFDWEWFIGRQFRSARMASYSFHWWFAWGKKMNPIEFEYVRTTFRGHVGAPCADRLEGVLETGRLIETPEFRPLFMTMDELMPELRSGVRDLVFYHYSSAIGLFQTLGLTERQDRREFHRNAQQNETYAQVTRFMRTHGSSSGAWFMAEDPDTSRSYGNWQVQLTVKRSARFAKWIPGVIEEGVTQTLRRLGVQDACDARSIASHNRNMFVHLLLEDEQVDFIEDHAGARSWFQFLRPQSALEMVDGDKPQ